MPNSVIYQTLFPIKNSFDTGRLGLGQTLVQNGKKKATNTKICYHRPKCRENVLEKENSGH